MKKWVSVLLMLCLLLGAVGCSVEDMVEVKPQKAVAPNLIGFSYEEIQQKYRDKYIFDVSRKANTQVAEGLITDQDPRPGEPLSGKTIRLVVSDGGEENVTHNTIVMTKKIPDVTDEFLETAVDMLKKEGFTADLQNVVYVNHPNYNRGVVVAQDPPAGIQLSTATPIQFTVASGFRDATITVPFPSSETIIDLQILINGKLKSENDLGIPLSNLLVCDLPSVTFKTTLQEASYSVEVLASLAGKKDFITYAVYEVNGNTGGVNRKTLNDLPAVSE